MIYFLPGLCGMPGSLGILKTSGAVSVRSGQTMNQRFTPSRVEAWAMLPRVKLL